MCMATHEYVWVRGGGQLFLTFSNCKNYKLLSEKSKIMLKQTIDKINGRLHVIKSSTIYQGCVDSVF